MPGFSHQESMHAPADLTIHARLMEERYHINRLDKFLGSNTLLHHATVWISTALEVSLYLLSVAGVLTIACLPLIVDAYMPASELSDRYAATTVLQVALAILAVPPVILALLIRRNRKKSVLIRQACSELRMLKEIHWLTMRELKM
jgi:hypothetical protein